MLPTGSITKVMLLSGFDAPTMTQAKTNPLPILMKVIDMSILPNKFKYDLRECFIMGEGYGDLSSERAYIRTNNLSCVTTTGKHIDMPFKAMATGEDGKIGLRGVVVTKQGALLARTIIAGFLQGIGESFSQSKQFSVIGGSETTQGVTDMNMGEALNYGAAGGLTTASEKLADFYLKMADQVAPVIEISAQREIELITTGITKFEFIEEKEDKKDEK
jgi:conjugal transfer pilus assembly protein TraB